MCKLRKMQFRNKQRMFGVFAIDEILRSPARAFYATLVDTSRH